MKENLIVNKVKHRKSDSSMFFFVIFRESKLECELHKKLFFSRIEIRDYDI